jgi:hypothetical protein
MQQTGKTGWCIRKDAITRWATKLPGESNRAFLKNHGVGGGVEFECRGHCVVKWQLGNT